MDVNIKVKFESPEIMAAILALADEINKLNFNGQAISKLSIEQKREEIKNPCNVLKSQGSKEKSKVNNEKATNLEEKITLKDIREKLILLIDKGKKSEVKELINRFGAGTLNEIKEKDYKNILSEANKL